MPVCGFAATLLVAAGLKAAAPADAWPAAGRLTAAGLEATVGCWLLSGVAAVSARRAAIALLAAFVAVNGYRWASGLQSCGCFGTVRVHPALTFAFDAGLLAWVASTRAMIVKPNIVRLWAAPVVALIMFSVAFHAGTPALAANLAWVSDRDIRTGQVLPLLDYLPTTDRSDLSHGHRSLILYDHSCAHCRHYLDALAQAAGPDTRLMDVSTDRRQRPQRGSLFLPTNVVVAVPVPLRVELRQGIVEAQWQPQ